MDEQKTTQFNFATPVAIIIAGVVIAGAVLASNRSGAAPTGAGAELPTTQAADIGKVRTAGEPFIGKQDAPATMAYWYDYQCPFCQRNEEGAMPLVVKEYVDTGRLKIVFKDYQFLGEDSQTLGRVSRAVWEVAPAKFYEWHKAIYDNQGTENTGWATKTKILSITTGVLGAADAKKVTALAEKNAQVYQKEMDADRNEGAGFGVNGTPGFIIGKQRIDGAVPYAQIKAAVEAALAGK